MQLILRICRPDGTGEDSMVGMLMGELAGDLGVRSEDATFRFEKSDISSWFIPRVLTSRDTSVGYYDNKLDISPIR